MKKTLRDYQAELSIKGFEILKKFGLVYLSMEVRCGKTATALEIAYLAGAKNVLFSTKKKAIKSIEGDYKDFGYMEKFKLTVTNDEGLHLVNDTFDLVIHDEHHRFGAFPKPNKTAKLFRDKYGKLPMIFLSGTPHPESYSQIFHQFWVKSGFWKKHINFYKWANDYVVKKKKHLGYAEVNDYTEVNPDGMRIIKKMQELLFISYTQKESGFTSSVKETVLECELKPKTYDIIKSLKKDLFYELGNDKIIISDTAVKLQQKLHQLYSGTVKFEDDSSMVIDCSKAEFIKHYFKDKKIAVFYKFKAELDQLKQVFKDDITDDLEIFNDTNKSIACQIVKFREGVSLKKADYLVYLNIDFSAVSYFQSRDRLTSFERPSNDVFWIFSNGGIEHQIYRSVLNKKNYTLSVFKRYNNIK